MLLLADDAKPTKIQIKDTDLNLSGGPTGVSDLTVSGVLTQVYIWAGIIAVIVIIVGAIRYITANGSADRIKAAKNTILYACVGLVVVIMAAAITQFIIANIAK